MKFRKTPRSKRKDYVYTYYGENGDKRTEHIVSGENGVTEKHIARLHSLDDKEVYNNLKNWRVLLTPKMKQDIIMWKRRHPDEDNPDNIKLYNVSLDDIETVLPNERYIQTVEENDVPYDVEHLREIIELLPEFDKKIYKLVLIDEMSKSEVAKLLSVTEGTIRYHINHIIKFIKNNF